METILSKNDFYGAYDRSGQGCDLKSKHIRQFNRDFLEASGFSLSMTVLELGCGNGLFLRYLDHIGANGFVGVDGDPRVLESMPTELVRRVEIADFSEYFVRRTDGATFDRVVLFDVLEHFSPEDGVALLRDIARILTPGGRVVVRVPNMASPWALSTQYNDVTHHACYTPGSLRQLASVAGFRIITVRPQAYATWQREFRERILNGVLSWFLSAPPPIWSPNMVGVLERDISE